MTKLKIAAVPDDKPVKVTAELPASVHRDLAAYAEAIARETGQRADPTKLIAPMLARFGAMVAACQEAFGQAPQRLAHCVGSTLIALNEAGKLGAANWALVGILLAVGAVGFVIFWNVEKK